MALDPQYYVNQLPVLMAKRNGIITERIKIRNRMIIHSQGIRPREQKGTDLNRIISRRLSESEATFKWRCDNYEPITQSVYERACDGMFRIFQDSQYSTELSDELETYLQTFSYEGLDFWLFVQQFCLALMLEDPNAWVVWLPTAEMISMQSNGTLPENIGVDVEPMVVTSDHQIYDDKNVRIWKDEACYRTSDGIDQPIYHVLTDEYWYSFTKSQYDNNSRSIALGYFNHNLLRLPALTLGGKLNTKGIYKSFFDAFCGFANQAISCFSDYQFALTHNSYPIMQIRPLDCDYQGCTNGYVTNETGQTTECPKCNGTGKHIRLNPSSVIVKTDKGGINGPNDFDSIKYYTPPFEPITMLKEAYESLLEQAERAVNVRYTWEAQSAAAKREDKDEFFTLLTRVSNNIFDNVMYNSLYIIELYRSGRNAQLPKIIKPMSFHIKGESELADELLQYQQLGGAYDQMSKQTYLALADKRFNGDPIQKKIAQFLINYDALCGMKWDELNFAISQNVISLNDAIRSIYAYSSLDYLINQDLDPNGKQRDGKEWFMNADYMTIKNDLDVLINQRIELNLTDKLNEEVRLNTNINQSILS
jgi:hypothetical protein